jgi:hypothetical protein
MIRAIKRAAAIAAIIVSATAASCSDAVHAEESHVCLGSSSSISR